MLIMVTARIESEEQRDELHTLIDTHPKVTDWYRHMNNQWVIELDDTHFLDFNKYLGTSFEDGERPTLFVNTLHHYNGWHSQEFWDFLRKYKTLPEPEAKGKSAKAKPDDEYAPDPADYAVRNAINLDDLELDPATSDTVSRYFTRLSFFQHAEAQGITLPDNHQNLLISGKPGVGKSTLGKSIGMAFAALNTERKVPVFFVKTAQIIGRYRGHTQKNMQALLDMAENGIIIFDEIDTFLDIDSDDRNALNVLNTHLGDRPNHPVVIGTIYESNRARFLAFNQGMQSRFPMTINIEGQDARKLSTLFAQAVENTGMNYDPEIITAVENLISEIKTAQRDNFGHIREIDNIMGAVVTNMAARYAENADAFTYHVTMADIPERDRKTGALVPRRMRPVTSDTVSGVRPEIVPFPKPKKD